MWLAFQRATRHTGAFKARGDDRDTDVVAHVRVDDRAEDHVHIRVGGLTDNSRGLVHFEERHVRAAGHVEEHAARTVNCDVEQLTRDRALRGFLRFIVA